MYFVKTALVLAGASLLLSACGGGNAASTPSASGQPAVTASASPGGSTGTPAAAGSPAPSTSAGGVSPSAPAASQLPAAGDAVQVVAKPDDVAVLVNKTYMLPDGYKPADLVEPDVPFIFKEKSEKRLMRKEAARALEQLVAGAKKDGIGLSGVSAYRSYETQKSLYNAYVKANGEEAAKKFSAVPGHSEHSTGLAIDMTGSSGKCAAEDCFAGTPEAKWLEAHAAEYGFIVRYPKGKEAVTGYQYEPWHIRYLGVNLAKEITAKGLTMEEYFAKATPVSR